MATGSVLLPVGASIAPDSTTGNAAAALARVKGSAAAPTPHFLEARFDGATDEMIMWAIRMPSNYASAPVLKVQARTVTATSGTFRFEGRIAAYTPGTDATDLAAKALAATNSAGQAVGSPAGRLYEVSITLTNNDSLAAGDWALVYLRRDADGTTGTDDITTDVAVVTAALEYTTT